MNESRPTPATLLLVDDDPSIIQAASRLLSDFGRCRFARSAADALRLLRQEPVDLVLLDAEMPEMGGLEMLSLMQKASDYGFSILELLIIAPKARNTAAHHQV